MPRFQRFLGALDGVGLLLRLHRARFDLCLRRLEFLDLLARSASLLLQQPAALAETIAFLARLCQLLFGACPPSFQRGKAILRRRKTAFQFHLAGAQDVELRLCSGRSAFQLGLPGARLVALLLQLRDLGVPVLIILGDRAKGVTGRDKLTAHIVQRRAPLRALAIGGKAHQRFIGARNPVGRIAERTEHTGIIAMMPHVGGEELRDFAARLDRIARPDQAQIILRPLDEAGRILQQIVKCREDASQAPRSTLTIQRIAQPQQHALGHQEIVAPLQRSRDFDGIAQRMDGDLINAQLIEDRPPEGHQDRQSRVLENEERRVTELAAHQFHRAVAKALHRRRFEPVRVKFQPFGPFAAARYEHFLIKVLDRLRFPIAGRIPLVSADQARRHVTPQQVESARQGARTGTVRCDDHDGGALDR